MNFKLHSVWRRIETRIYWNVKLRIWTIFTKKIPLHTHLWTFDLELAQLKMHCSSHPRCSFEPRPTQLESGFSIAQWVGIRMELEVASNLVITQPKPTSHMKESKSHSSGHLYFTTHHSNINIFKKQSSDGAGWKEPYSEYRMVFRNTLTFLLNRNHLWSCQLLNKSLNLSC